jgi:hypothetical protein
MSESTREHAAVALLKEIASAFAGVSRTGGSSWTDALAMGHMGVPHVTFPVTHREDDATWLDVANDRTWDPSPNFGGFGYLDAIGYRYYLAAAMYRAVRERDPGELVYRLELPFKTKARRQHLSKWILTRRQHEVALKVAVFFRDAMYAQNRDYEFDEWQRVIDSWRGVDVGGS